MLEGRELARDEIASIWALDRSEVIEAIYRLVDGRLTLTPERYDLKGWPPGESEKYTPILEESFDRGGWFYCLFDGDEPAGVAVLDTRFVGRNEDQLQLELLHVGRRFRHAGLGRELFALAADEARGRGGSGLYISATPSRHTIDFYLRLGCQIASVPDPELLALEPDDIHLEYRLEPAPK